MIRNSWIILPQAELHLEEFTVRTVPVWLSDKSVALQNTSMAAFLQHQHQNEGLENASIFGLLQVSWRYELVSFFPTHVFVSVIHCETYRTHTDTSAHRWSRRHIHERDREKDSVTNQEQQTVADNEAFSSDGCRECLLHPLTWQKNWKKTQI